MPHPLADHEVARFRERLTEAASRLFAERGYEGVTLRAIAAELGCSPMTPYRYFQDKGDIYAAVRTAAYDAFADVQEAALASEADPLDALAALGGAYVSFARNNPDAYRLMFELAQPDPAAYPDLRAAELRSWRPLRSAIETLIEAGVLEGDPDTVAHVFWCGVHGLASLHLAGKLALGRDVDALGLPMLGTLVRGNRNQAPEETS